METESGVPSEDEKKVILQGEGSSLDINNEMAISSEPNPVAKEKQNGCITSAAEFEKLSTKSPNKIKDSDKNVLKTNKLTKNLSNPKGTAVFGRNTKPGLSKSLSFPARGRHSDVTKRRTTLPSSSSLRQSTSVKYASTNGSAPKLAQVVLIEENAESGNNESLTAKEEDARSTTSSNATPRSQQRNNIPIFRLEERAEKRKEFFTKIEEKIHAKEEEESNLQARSKKNLEAEIKQLRKSLTFKATPMPSFYKEPQAKVELKKLPTTRPISPKLGRNKGIATMSSNTHENGRLHLSQQVTRGDAKSKKVPLRNSEKGNAILKKSIKNSIAKAQSRESSTPRKEKLSETENLEQTQIRPCCIAESLEEPRQEEIEKTSREDFGYHFALRNSEEISAEVIFDG